MELVTEYLRKARGVTQATFQQFYPHLFLYKHPKLVREEPNAEPDIDYATSAIDLNFDPMPGETQLAPVKKNPGNPYPDRLTIGRATNCDVVLRFAFVSKVHARIFIHGAQLILHDNKPSNSTFHNKKKLEPGGARDVKLGDTLGFGALELELIDGARLYQLLRAGAPSRQGNAASPR